MVDKLDLIYGVIEKWKNRPVAGFVRANVKKFFRVRNDPLLNREGLREDDTDWPQRERPELGP